MAQFESHRLPSAVLHVAAINVDEVELASECFLINFIGKG